jgi:hypothetical protein
MWLAATATLPITVPSDNPLAITRPMAQADAGIVAATPTNCAGNALRYAAACAPGLGRLRLGRAAVRPAWHAPTHCSRA